MTSMFTRCPKCALTLAVTAGDLRVAQGYVRCGRCSNIFNAMTRLAHDEQQAGASNAATAATPALAERDSPGAATRHTGAVTVEDEQLPEAALEFNAEATDITTVFVEPPPATKWSNTTTVKTLGLRNEPRQPQESTQELPAVGAGRFGPRLDEDLLSETVQTPALPGDSTAQMPLPQQAPLRPRPAAYSRVTQAPATPQPAPRATTTRASAAPPTPSRRGATTTTARAAPTPPPPATSRAPGPAPAQADALPPRRIPPRPPARTESVTRAPAPIPLQNRRIPPRPPGTVTAVAVTSPAAPALTTAASLVAAAGAAGRVAAWRIGTAVLSVFLVLQIVNHYRDDLATNPRFNRPLTELYGSLGVRLVPRWDVNAYDVRQLGASADSTRAGQITVHASVKNAAHRAQPLPLLRVTLRDRFGNGIAARDVPPQFYLPATARSSYLSPGQRIDAEMAFVDPGENAYGFEIDACLPAPGGGMACLSDSGER